MSRLRTPALFQLSYGSISDRLSITVTVMLGFGMFGAWRLRRDSNP